MITEEDLLGAYSFPSDSPRPDESPDSPECSAPPNDSPKDFAQPDGSSEASNSHRPDESPDSPECSAPPNDSPEDFAQLDGSSEGSASSRQSTLWSESSRKTHKLQEDIALQRSRAAAGPVSSRLSAWSNVVV
ncbi:uncharacterized protein LOC135105632 [Scylla paramamosain]|uniref:uncharacterized protein LOC135105632 n=1 Tax=Scylla paramamosain TaxID=85552 RepID=UPI003083E610